MGSPRLHVLLGLPVARGSQDNRKTRWCLESCNLLTVIDLPPSGHAFRRVTFSARLSMVACSVPVPRSSFGLCDLTGFVFLYL